TTYQEPESYRATFCDRLCAYCRLQLKLEDAEEVRATGIEMLLSDSNETISLTPENNERMERRNHG
ncbi:MAG: lysine 2,3-aminomutase, partial [Desulfuromonadaceae bacterium]